VAYMEECDENDIAIEGTKVAASVVQKSNKSNIGKSRSAEKARRTESSSPNMTGQTDSDSTVHPSSSSKADKERLRRKEKEREMKEKEKEKRERSSSSKKSVSIRPGDKQPRSKTQPILNQSSYRRPATDESGEYFGVRTEAPTLTQPALRPRAFTSNPNRNSYHFGPNSRPPSANVKWHAANSPAPYSPLPVSYPPQPWTAPTPPAYASPSPIAPPAQQDYFNAQHHHLKARFQQRPSSAMGHRPTPSSTYSDDYYDRSYGGGGLARRASLTRKLDEDRLAMPPPARPHSVMPTQGFRPPPVQRRSVGFEDDAFSGDPHLYADIMTRPSYELGSTAPPRPRRGSFQYNGTDVTLEPASTRGHRQSWYGGGPASDIDEKIRRAATYQDDVSGVPLMLTKENMRKATKRSGGGSSQSTRSSASRDESDWKQSNTTRTTRSSNGDEDITIKVTGPTVLKVGGAEIQCEGGEININSKGSVRGGSDKASSIYVDERRSRVDRIPTRTRPTSQSGSWSRSQPPYDPYNRPYF
jgi:hypothetical protein